MQIVVTIPAYNEEDSIGKVVYDVKQVLGSSTMVLVVSDGSTDETVREASNAGAVVYEKQHSGLADTFRCEMALVKKYTPDLIVHTDADGQYMAKDIPKLIERAKRGYDLVLGSRLTGHIEFMPWSKRIINVAGSVVIMVWLWQLITDATTGFRVFTPGVARLPIMSDFTYTIEQIIRTSDEGYEITSVPVTFKARKGSESRLISNAPDYVWKTLKNLRKMLGKGEHEVTVGESIPSAYHSEELTSIRR